MLAALPARAQAGPEPAALERTIPREPTRAPLPPVGYSSPREADASAPATGKFTLGAVNVEGSTIYSQEELSRDFEPYLANEVDGSKLGQMAARITDRYREAGYLLSYATIPTQGIQAGMVRLSVVEGRIGSLSVQGAGADQHAVEAIAAPVLADRPLKTATLERAIGLIRDFPGLAVTDVALMRSDAGPGVYRLKITVARNRVRAFSYMDNRGTDSVGNMRLYSSAAFASVAIEGDELRADLFTMPGRSFRYVYGQLQASAPIGRNGLRLTLTASRGDQLLRGDERIDGDSTNLSGMLSYPLVRSRALTVVTKLALSDWRSFGSADGVRNLRDRFRVARAGLEFSNEGRTRIQGELTISRGLGFDGMTRVGDPLASREDASGRFTKAAFIVQAARPLSANISIQAVAAGQYSKRPLLSAEEFSLGGNRIGRAFDFNALTADRGVGGALELSYRLPESKRSPRNLELFTFIDGGAAFEARSAAAADRRRSLASAGVGTRFALAGMAFSIEAGVPLAAPGRNKPVRLFASTYRAF